MRLTPRRILLHTIIVLVTLALPLLLPSSCGPVVHSGAVLTAGILELTHYPRLGQVDSRPAYRPLLVAHSTDALDAACFRLRLYCGWIAQTGVASSHLLSVNWRTADPSARMTNNSP